MTPKDAHLYFYDFMKINILKPTGSDQNRMIIYVITKRYLDVWG